MLLLPGRDKKKLASVIVAGITPDFVGKDKGGYDVEVEYEAPEDESMEMDEGMVATAEKVLECVKSGDATGLAEALKDMISICS